MERDANTYKCIDCNSPDVVQVAYLKNPGLYDYHYKCKKHKIKDGELLIPTTMYKSVEKINPFAHHDIDETVFAMEQKLDIPFPIRNNVRDDVERPIEVLHYYWPPTDEMKAYRVGKDGIKSIEPIGNFAAYKVTFDSGRIKHITSTVMVSDTE